MLLGPAVDQAASTVLLLLLCITHNLQIPVGCVRSPAGLSVILLLKLGKFFSTRDLFLFTACVFLFFFSFIIERMSCWQTWKLCMYFTSYTARCWKPKTFQVKTTVSPKAAVEPCLLKINEVIGGHKFPGVYIPPCGLLPVGENISHISSVISLH